MDRHLQRGAKSAGSGRHAWALVCAALVLAGARTADLRAAQGSGGEAPGAPGAATVPSGTVLYLRLTSPVSTKTSKGGDAVKAVVARDVLLQDGVAVPAGATLEGKVKTCVQPATPQDHAQLLLNFTKLDIPGGQALSLSGRVSAVSNAREKVLDDGTIQGVLETDAPASLLSGALERLGALNPQIGQEIQKQKIGAVDTAIEYAAGTDIQFTLTQPLAVARLLAAAGPPALPADLTAALASFLAGAPQRAVSKDNRPGDPLNLLFIGTPQEIEQAFSKVGWTEPKEKNGASIWDTARAVMNDEGYGAAPVSDLFVFGRKEDLAFEKMLNTFDKRHHLRLWQSTERAPDGRPIWVGAATHDVGIDVHPGVVSHATDPNLDDERDQVRADLTASNSVEALQLVASPNALSTGFTATGGAWHTDGKMLAIEVKPAATMGATP